jgi:hypothetical protein
VLFVGERVSGLDLDFSRPWREEEKREREWDGELGLCRMGGQAIRDAGGWI